jgi:hypothetical protein
MKKHLSLEEVINEPAFDRLLIEIDSDADDMPEVFGVSMESFKTVITEAFGKKEEIIHAVEFHDDVFCMTSFIGNSGILFNELVQYALTQNQWKGKRLFIMYRSETIWWSKVNDLKKFTSMFEVFTLENNNRFVKFVV